MFGRQPETADGVRSWEHGDLRVVAQALALPGHQGIEPLSSVF